MQPLPDEFLKALAGHDEVLVTSREGTTRGTVPVWFLILPPGVVYLFGFGFSVKRLAAGDPTRGFDSGCPASQTSAEGVAHFVGPDEIDAIAPRIVEHWAMQGAPTLEGLRRTLRDRVHVLVRVEGAAAGLTSGRHQRQIHDVAAVGAGQDVGDRLAIEPGLTRSRSPLRTVASGYQMRPG